MRWWGALFAAWLCLGAGSVRAEDIWYGPGWYVVATQYGVILWSGPYENEDECALQKPADGDPPGFTYDCTYFDLPPSQ